VFDAVIDTLQIGSFTSTQGPSLERRLAAKGASAAQKRREPFLDSVMTGLDVARDGRRHTRETVVLTPVQILEIAHAGACHTQTIPGRSVLFTWELGASAAAGLNAGGWRRRRNDARSLSAQRSLRWAAFVGKRRS
jgi:hypothetical protein